MTNARMSIDAAFARETAPGPACGQSRPYRRQPRTVVGRLVATGLLAALGLLNAQCVSLARAVELTPSDTVVVTLFQPAAEPSRRNPNPTDLQQRLLNQAAVQAFGLSQADQLSKAVPAELMQLLLDAFATGGFFEHAGTRRLTSGHTLLQVRINDRDYIWTRALAQWSAEPGIDTSELQRRANQFTLCQAAFLDLYNATRSYRTGTGMDTVMEKHKAQIRGRGGRR